MTLPSTIFCTKKCKKKLLVDIPDTTTQDIDNSAPAVIMEGDIPSQENSPRPYAQDFFMGIGQ